MPWHHLGTLALLVVLPPPVVVAQLQFTASQASNALTAACGVLNQNGTSHWYFVDVLNQ